MKANRNNLQRLVGTALLAAIVIILQCLSVLPIGPISFTLALLPIVLGAILFGPSCGAILGAVFGIVVAIQTMTGALGTFCLALFESNKILTVSLCLFKGILAGFGSGLIYRLFSKAKKTAAAFLAAIFCPICNTGIFSVALLTFFSDVVRADPSNQFANIFSFVVIGVIGVNFLVEFAVNVLLTPVALRVINIVQKRIR